MYLFRDGTRVLSKRRVDVLTPAGRFKLVVVITKLGFEPFLIAPILAGWRTSTAMVSLRYWKRVVTGDHGRRHHASALVRVAHRRRQCPKAAQRAERSDER